jgi:hypothetical protein
MSWITLLTSKEPTLQFAHIDLGSDAILFFLKGKSSSMMSHSGDKS